MPSHDQTSQQQEQQPPADSQAPAGEQQPRPGHPAPAHTAAPPASVQQHAHRLLGDLLDSAAEHNLPSIEWRIAAFEAHLTGRCTAYPGPARRRADFEAWRALLGAHTREDTTAGPATRLTARAERDNGQVTVEIIADLYDDPATPLTTPSTPHTWRAP